MSVTLSTYVQNDTDYVAKLNNNAAIVQGAINALQTATAGASGALSVTAMMSALFGTLPVLIQAGSYAATTNGTNLTLSAGYAWNPTVQSVVSMTAQAILNFVGQAAGTYYIQLDGSGNPSFVTSSSAAFYSVVWSGTAFTSVTCLAGWFFTASDDTAVLTSATSTTAYATLAARLNAIEGRPVLTDGTTDHLIVPTDAAVYLRMTNADANAVTFQPNSTQALPANSEYQIRCAGAGSTTLTAGTGVTLNPPASGSLVLTTGMYARVKWVAVNTFDVIV